MTILRDFRGTSIGPTQTSIKMSTRRIGSFTIISALFINWLSAASAFTSTAPTTRIQELHKLSHGNTTITGGNVTEHANISTTIMMIATTITPYNVTPTEDDSESGTVSYPMQIFIGVLYAFIFVVGIAGNVLVCYVVFRNKAMQTVTNYFITNLALSDILLCILAVPFTPLYTFVGKWVFGTLLCHIVPYAQGCSVYISTLTLTAVAIDRFFVIVYPFQPRMKLSVCIGIIVGIWLFALLVTLPYGLYMRIEEDSGDIFCEENWSRSHSSIKIIFSICTTMLQFAIPFLVITFCYVCVSIKLNDRARLRPGSKTSKREEADRDRKKRTNRMLIAMVAVFGISWMPLNVYNIKDDLDGEGNTSMLIFFASHAIAMSSTCYNPFLYAWLNENFRKEFIQILPCLFRALSPLNGSGGGTSGNNTGSSRNNVHNRSRRCMGPTSTYDPERLLDQQPGTSNGRNGGADGEQRLLRMSGNNNNNISCSNNNNMNNNCDSEKNNCCQRQDQKDLSVIGMCSKVASNVLSSKRTRDTLSTTQQIPLVDPISSCTSSSCTTATSSSVISSGHQVVSAGKAAAVTVIQLSPQHTSVDTAIVSLPTHSSGGGSDSGDGLVGDTDGILETHFEEIPTTTMNRQSSGTVPTI